MGFGFLFKKWFLITTEVLSRLQPYAQQKRIFVLVYCGVYNLKTCISHLMIN